METSTDRSIALALELAVQQAIRAPSVHNTQPWRFTIRANALEILADQSRRLPVIDPDGRELLLSCGAALHTARVALAAAGHDCAIDRIPDPDRPDLLAVLRLRPPTPSSATLAELGPHIIRRASNRRQFSKDTVSAELIVALVAAAGGHGTVLVPIKPGEDRLTVGRLSQRADQRQVLDPAYRAELRAWTSADPHRRDGVYAMTVPHVAAGRSGELPIRDFDTHGSGYLPVDTGSNAEQCLLVLGTYSDDAAAWLRSGEALQHVLLEITRHNYAASPFTQIVEDSETRTELGALLRMSMHPQVLLRVGHAPPTPGSPRRRLSEVLHTDGP